MVWIISGCTESFEPSSKVRFFIKPSWISPDIDYPPQGEYIELIALDSFPHIYGPCQIEFKVNQYLSHKINSGDKALNEYAVKLPVGKYSVWGNGGEFHNFTTGVIPYHIPRQEVEITDSTRFIILTLEPVCGMIIIADQHEEIGRCIITYESDTIPLKQIDNLYYIYFRHMHDPRVIVNFLDGNSYTIRFGIFKEGYINQIYSSDLKLSGNR